MESSVRMHQHEKSQGTIQAFEDIVVVVTASLPIIQTDLDRRHHHSPVRRLPLPVC